MEEEFVLSSKNSIFFKGVLLQTLLWVL